MSSSQGRNNRVLSIADMLNTPPGSTWSGLASAGQIQHAESSLRSTANHPENAEEPISRHDQLDERTKHEVDREEYPVVDRDQEDNHQEQPNRQQHQPFVRQDIPVLKQVEPVAQQAEPRKIIPPFHFSPSRGSLHERRRSRSISPTKKPNQHSYTQEEPQTPTKAPRLQPNGRILPSASQDTNLPTPPISNSNHLASLPPIAPIKRRLRPNVSIRKKPFNIFQALMQHQDLVLNTTGLLPLDELIGLYAICKDFHTMVNRNATTFMKHYSRVNAPGCSNIFQFRFYPALCMRDPTPRPNDDRPSETRTIPSFRWLRMLVFRQMIVRDIVLIMAADGMRMPAEAHLALKKVWLLLDLPYNKTRLSMMHNPKFWSDQDLFRATLWFVKLDMLFGDPITGTGNEVDMRKLLFAQRSLTVLWRVLRRELFQTEMDIMQLYVGTWYQPLPLSDSDGASLMGVPAHLVGRMNHEGWGAGQERLLRPDELVMRESMKRDLRLDTQIMDMMSYGFLDEETWEMLPFPGYDRVREVQLQRREKRIKSDLAEEVEALMVERGSTVGSKRSVAESSPGVSSARWKGKEKVQHSQTVASVEDIESKDSRPLDSGYYSGLPSSSLTPLLAIKGDSAPSPANTPRTA
ncbi:hypothetical protein EV356DRAFT_504730 [Viridothelium virens]|uniref:Uncharacterized protein n=1 Tax=Viridothelium virens TaxID=1048519 RepID=A0A6A6H439_VIRVR|nr:hypothetical protein EV356DRAFT_504730 [Viridothelium virens]